MTLPTAETFARLSPRHLDCLRRTQQLKTTKEIAAELGLSPGTVDNYCARAVAILSARDRRDAARMLAAHEDAPSVSHMRDAGEAAAPLTGHPSGGTSPIDWRSLLPFRRKGSDHNELSILLRLAWIPILAVVGAVILSGGFAFVVFGLEVLSRLYRAVR